MSATLANALRVIGALLLVVIWCFGLMPLLGLSPASQFLISLPLGGGLSIFLAVRWRDV